jgi:hypothetical protein
MRTRMSARTFERFIPIARAIAGDQTPEGSGANGTIWPAMMSAELPEGWA